MPELNDTQTSRAPDGPADPERDDAVPPAARGSARRRPAPTVVVVERDAALQKLICEALGDRYRVVPVPPGEDAQRRSWTTDPDVIVTDLATPGVGGTHLIERIRADRQLSGVPLLAISALGDDANRLELLRAGVNDYLVKPFSILELRARVANLIELRQAERRRRQLGLVGERARIACDLHDVVIQRLYAAGLRLHKALSVRDADGGQTQAVLISGTIEELDAVINEIRSTIFDLHTPDDGLVRRISALAAALAVELGARPRVDLPAELDRLDGTAVGANLLCVVEEALSNIRRHAHATTFEVAIDMSSVLLALTVADDGRGLDSAQERTGLGLLSMWQRAEALGGTFAVETGESGGTEITWAVPLDGVPRNGRREPV